MIREPIQSDLSKVIPVAIKKVFTWLPAFCNQYSRLSRQIAEGDIEQPYSLFAKIEIVIDRSFVLRFIHYQNPQGSAHRP